MTAKQQTFSSNLAQSRASLRYHTRESKLDEKIKTNLPSVCFLRKYYKRNKGKYLPQRLESKKGKGMHILLAWDELTP